MPTVIDEGAIRSALDEPTIWPNLSQAAGITGLNKSTLSKQAHAGNIDSKVRGFGQGERVLPPKEVLRIGNCYHRLSQSTVVDRLATFLSRRLSTDASVVQRVLWTLMEAPGHDQSQVRPAAKATINPNTIVETPNWLLEVEHLRENSSALKGTLSFTSADDLIGVIELGPSIDETAGVDRSARTAVW